MTVVYHVGLHCTDEDRALRCLLKNAAELAYDRTVVPMPSRFRPVLRQAMIHLRGDQAGQDLQEQILDEITDIDAPQRIVLSSDSFLCVPRRAIDGGRLYPLAGERAPWMRGVFPGAQAEFAFALRNPATLIPALHARFSGEETFAEFLMRIRPEDLSWSDMVERFKRSVPDCPLTIWCNEDTPLIWPEILSALSGRADGMDLEGVYDFLDTIMSEEGMDRMLAYLDSHPPRNAEHRRRVVSAFLDKFALEQEVEVEMDLPGWTDERVAWLSARYEADVALIRQMDGIHFIDP